MKKFWVSRVRFHTIKSAGETNADVEKVAQAIYDFYMSRISFMWHERDYSVYFESQGRDYHSIYNYDAAAKNWNKNVIHDFTRLYEEVSEGLNQADIALLNAELKARKYGLKAAGIIK